MTDMTAVQQQVADQLNIEVDQVAERLTSFPDGPDRDTALDALEACRQAGLQAVESTIDQAIVEVDAECQPTEEPQDGEAAPIEAQVVEPEPSAVVDEASATLDDTEAASDTEAVLADEENQGGDDMADQDDDEHATSGRKTKGRSKT